MITSTSLRHPMLRIRLDLAMRVAACKSLRHSIGVDHVSGIYVVHSRIRPGCRGTGGFTFYDSKERNITKTVLAALRGLNP